MYNKQHQPTRLTQWLYAHLLKNVLKRSTLRVKVGNINAELLQFGCSLVRATNLGTNGYSDALSLVPSADEFCGVAGAKLHRTRD